MEWMMRTRKIRSLTHRFQGRIVFRNRKTIYLYFFDEKSWHLNRFGGITIGNSQKETRLTHGFLLHLSIFIGFFSASKFKSLGGKKSGAKSIFANVSSDFQNLHNIILCDFQTHDISFIRFVLLKPPLFSLDLSEHFIESRTRMSSNISRLCNIPNEIIITSKFHLFAYFANKMISCDFV